METLEAIGTRKSVRAFLRQDVPLSLVRAVLEAGMRAPSGGNCQPWRFVVVTDKENLAKMESGYKRPFTRNASGMIVACVNPHDTWAKYGEDDTFGWLLDTAAAIENMLLALHDLGLGGVWIMDIDKRLVRSLLGIPCGWQIVSVIPFGYPASHDDRPTARKPLSDVAFLDGMVPWPDPSHMSVNSS